MRNWLSILLLLFTLGAEASHIVGGHFEITRINDTLYRIELVILRDCSGIQPRNIYTVGVFDSGDSTRYQNLSLQLNPNFTPVDIGDSCFSPTSLCIQKWTAAATVILPQNPDGYFFVAQEYARNPGITNIISALFPDVGMTWLIKFPDPAIPGGNSSPVFRDYPANGYLCLNQLREIDFSATDPDGDSLAYRMVTPLEGHVNATGQPPPQPPPYFPVTWAPGYSLNAVTPGPVPLEIDPVTGIVKAHPNLLGTFVFSYVVDEFRNGVKIGESRRDLQMEVLNCYTNEPPVFVAPQATEFSTTVHNEICFPVEVTDPNTGDSIYLQTSYTSVPADNFPDELRLVNRMGVGSVSGRICWRPSCSESLSAQQINLRLRAYSEGCDGTDTIYKSISLKVEPLPQDLESLLPNIFTPNADGINDRFQLQNESPYPCIGDLEVRIYNRWGSEIHNGKLSRMSWDGTYKGRPLPEGVYYYLISGSYINSPFSYKGFVTLTR